MELRQALLNQAVIDAKSGKWDKAHKAVQGYADEFSCWIHAVLHKIEGDEENSRYWYGRTTRRYEAFSDPKIELDFIASQITQHF